jgi:transposase
MGKVYSQEFKDQIVALHRTGRTFVDIGREFQISATTVTNWVREADRKQLRGSVTADPGDDLKLKVAQLERELARKDEELEILGKALAFFARRAEQ